MVLSTGSFRLERPVQTDTEACLQIHLDLDNHATHKPPDLTNWLARHQRCLTIHRQRPAQQRAAMRLIPTGLSPAAYVTVATIMGLENVLDYIEAFVVRFECAWMASMPLMRTGRVMLRATTWVPHQNWRYAVTGGDRSRSSTPVWASNANRSGTPQCSTIRPSTIRATSNTVSSTLRPDGGPKNGPVAVPRA